MFLFYRVKDVYQQIIEDWGKYDMAIQPFIICKSRKTSMLRYEVHNQSMVKAVSITNDYNILKFPYLETSQIVNKRKDVIDWDELGQGKKKEEGSTCTFNVMITCAISYLTEQYSNNSKSTRFPTESL